jgi:hypothetical protein
VGMGLDALDSTDLDEDGKPLLHGYSLGTLRCRNFVDQMNRLSPPWISNRIYSASVGSQSVIVSLRHPHKTPELAHP